MELSAGDSADTVAVTAGDFVPETIARIRSTVESHTRRTPLIRSDWLSQHAGVSVFLKCENLQVTGAFKIRGVLAALSQLTSGEREAGVFTCSTGNHGIALAYGTSSQGIPCRVVVPPDTPQVKRKRIQEFGAELVESPRGGYDATQAWTLEQQPSWGQTFVSPFEDPWVVAGNGGTTGLEILEDLPGTREIITPVGGGGLGLGLALAVESVKSRTRIAGINSEACPSMAVSFEKDEAQLVMEGRPTLADAIEGGVGAITYALLRDRLHSVRVVREASIGEAIAGTIRREHQVVEGAGATGVAALLEGYVPLDPCVILLSGGNINAHRLAVLLGSD